MVFEYRKIAEGDDMNLIDFCKKEDKLYLLEEWDAEKTSLSHPKLLLTAVLFPCGGDAVRGIHGRHSFEAVPQPLQDVPSAMRLPLPRIADCNRNFLQRKRNPIKKECK